MWLKEGGEIHVYVQLLVRKNGKLINSKAFSIYGTTIEDVFELFQKAVRAKEAQSNGRTSR